MLPRLIGFQKASALMLLGDKVNAVEAERLGMIYQAVTDEKLEELGWSLGTKLAELPTKGLGLTKRLLNLSFNNSLEQQLEEEKKIQALAAASHDHKEGVMAFLEKRAPVFTGN